jgi:hypothetical protein
MGAFPFFGNDLVPVYGGPKKTKYQSQVGKFYWIVSLKGVLRQGDVRSYFNILHPHWALEPNPSWEAGGSLSHTERA